MIDIEKRKEIKERFQSLTDLIADPETAADPKQMATLGPEHRELIGGCAGDPEVRDHTLGGGGDA